MTLREAADKLFDIRAVPDEFFELEEGSPLRIAIILKQLSVQAGPWRQYYCATDKQCEAAICWMKSAIPDALHEAQRIADTVREVRLCQMQRPNQSRT